MWKSKSLKSFSLYVKLAFILLIAEGLILFKIGCRNLLIEGGNLLSKNILKNKLFNQFYLYKSPKSLSKLVDYKEFNFFKDLSQNYKSKSKLNTKFSKDLIMLYRK